jgi:quercetin dioxygenase-like cupin family protein
MTFVRGLVKRTSLKARTGQRGITSHVSVLAYDLEKESEALIREALSVEDGRATKTLAKVSRLHVVLTALRHGFLLQQHATHAPISIQAIRGSIHLLLPTQAIHLTPGMVVTLEPEIAHSVEAQVDSAFLISMAWAEKTSR